MIVSLSWFAGHVRIAAKAREPGRGGRVAWVGTPIRGFFSTPSQNWGFEAASRGGYHWLVRAVRAVRFLHHARDYAGSGSRYGLQ